MREFDPFPPASSIKRKADKTIRNRIIACYRDREFYDGDRANGYGGYKDDGRWGPVADALIKAYGLGPDSTVLQINCHKGFLLKELLARGINVHGTEVSDYAISCAHWSVAPFIRKALFTHQPYGDREADLVLAMSPVYAGNLADAIAVLKEVMRLSRKHAFVTLATYDSEEDYWLLRKWYTLGSLILRREEWIEVLNHCGYRGDHKFDTAKTLNLE